MRTNARRVLMAAPLVLVAAYFAVPGMADAGGPILNAYNLVAVSSAVIVIVAVVLHRPQPMWPWLLVAAAVLAWVLGDAAYIVHGGSPIVSIADAFYIPAYVALIVACLAFVRLRTRQRDTDSLIDAAMVTVAGGLALWVLVVQPTWNTAGTSTIEQIIAPLYPLLDVILLGMLVRLLVVPGRRPASVFVLAIGMASVLTADTVYALLVQTNDYQGDVARALDATWLLGYALFPLAALLPSMRDLSRVADTPGGAQHGRRFVAGAALASLPVVLLAASLLGRDPGVETMAVTGCMVVPLILWRIVRLNHANESAREAIARKESYYRAVAMNASDAFVVVDRDAKVLDASAALQALVGFGTEDVVGGDGLAIIVDEDRELGMALLGHSLAEPGIAVADEVRIRTASGAVMWAELRCTNLLDDPAVRGVVVNTHDITARKRIEHELAHQAFHDSLTSLANRALLTDRIDHALTARARGNDVAVIFCDLDGFKLVNDTLGHVGGDAVLCTAGSRLAGVVRARDTVARLGGDEFAILLEGADHLHEEAGALAERMRCALSDPFVISDIPLVVTGSFGIAIASEGGQTTSEELLRDADTAMYRAKKAGRNRVARYEPSMRAADLSKAELEVGLRVAVAHGELVVQYQPVVELVTERLAGFEALVRWDHPTRGRLQPDEFIAIAESTGTIAEIGRWVLNRACNTAKEWQRRSSADVPVTMAVNISARQLTDPTFVADVADALTASGLPPATLILELTESVLVHHPDEVAAQLRALKELGVQLAIDDFGVGYSSLSYLQQFPVDILKIDRSFVERIDRDDRVPAIVRGVLELARTLGLETVAEGIETDAQWHSLADEGCELGQGFRFAKPLDEADAIRLLDERALAER